MRLLINRVVGKKNFEFSLRTNLGERMACVSQFLQGYKSPEAVFLLGYLLKMYNLLTLKLPVLFTKRIWQSRGRIHEPV